MSLKRNLLTAGIAAAAIIGSTIAALAAPAYATATVNVRAGPGTGYSAIDTLRPGEGVDIDYCRGSWCFVTKSGPDGWVSASYLSRGSYDRYYDDDDDFYLDRRLVRPYRSYRPYRPYYSPRSSACIGGPNASFCISN